MKVCLGRGWLLGLFWDFLGKSLTQSFGGVSCAPVVGSEHCRCQTLLAGAAGSKIPPYSSFSRVSCARLPLERGKKLRDVLREKDLLHQFFQHHHYDIGTKFPHAFPNGSRVVTEPLLNTLDVSVGSNPRGTRPWEGLWDVHTPVLGMNQTQILYPKAFSSHPSLQPMLVALNREMSPRSSARSKGSPWRGGPVPVLLSFSLLRLGSIIHDKHRC